MLDVFPEIENTILKHFSFSLGFWFITEFIFCSFTLFKDFDSPNNVFGLPDAHLQTRRGQENYGTS